MELEVIPAYEYPREIEELFTEYTDMLIAGDPTFQNYLNIQHYDQEIAHPEQKYGPPHGRLYLARWGGEPAGCIGLRRLCEQSCEMKRLYVRPQFRGNGIGDVLIRKIIADAKEIGYAFMLLDTLPFLKPAIRMYQKVGFYEVPRYNDSPMDTCIYMRLDLI